MPQPRCPGSWETLTVRFHRHNQCRVGQPLFTLWGGEWFSRLSCTRITWSKKTSSWAQARALEFMIPICGPGVGSEVLRF